MIAYNSTFINNLNILKKAKQWYAQKLVSDEQMKSVSDKYKTGFYQPNIFIKIGLFLFTSFIILAALGLFVLLFTSANVYSSNGFAIITSLLFAISCIVALELLIKAKLLYQSGIDEALLYAGILFLYSAFRFMFIPSEYDYINDSVIEKNNVELLSLIAILPFTIATAIRYIDRLVAMLSLLILYSICFLFILKLGDVAKLIMPFALVFLSAVFYSIIIKQKSKPTLIPWKNQLASCEAIAMLVFYLASNYFVIRECSVEFFYLELNPRDDIPLAWLFYILTAIVPLAYIYYGLKRKNKLSLLVGLILVVISVLTFKYYFSLGHPEISFTIAGIMMLIISYLSIRYLKTDKHGLTYKEEIDEDNFLKSNAEALAIVQSFSQQTNTASKPEDFGGGEFGGGGSGSNF